MRWFRKGKNVPISVALVLALLLPSWLQAQDSSSDCYVLSAGVDNYRNANKLSGCLNDARNTTAAFRAQQGTLFGKVHAETLLDGSASRDNISTKFENFSRQGKAGDVMVLFLSGHGARTNNDKTWYFLPFDFHPGNQANTILTDRQILDAADTLVQQKKKVFIIVDACFSGQLHATAQSYFNRYRNPQGGGLVVMLSSSATQTSAALGNYSAFAKAFADSMTASGDLNNDGKVTLQEIKQYTYKRTYQLLKQKNMSDKQDSLVAWSQSISENMPLASTIKLANSNSANPVSPPVPVNPVDPVTPTNPEPLKTGTTRWAGKETLPGYGKLTFTLSPGGKVVMVDAKDTSEGTWQQKGNQYTLRFSDGRVTYSGKLNGSTLSGTARNDRTTWNWSVSKQ